MDAHLPSIVAQFAKHPALLLKASPGSGKTTRVPPALLKVLPTSQALWVLEPRRLAALWSARRVASEQRWKLGQEIGYQFRFEREESAQTRLLFLTEGTFLRRLLSNPTLKGVGAVVLDEFHERHLQTDMALALLRHLQATERPDLKIVLMSATLDLNFLAEAASWPVIDVVAPPYPLEVIYGDKNDQRDVGLKLVDAVREALKLAGDILVFLPGQKEILAAEAKLRAPFRQDLDIRVLHGSLSRGEQDEALSPSSRRRLVLSTNLAESSLTVPGVRIVIDSGQFRAASFSHWNGLSRLQTQKISQASAIQRAGRANREAPGYCLRLYSKLDYDARENYETPEFLRTDLSQAFLELFSLGLNPVENFNWPEKIPEELAQKALSDLRMLGAIDQGAITPIGRQMLRYPLAPRFARILVAAQARPEILPTVARHVADLSAPTFREAVFKQLQSIAGISAAGAANVADEDLGEIFLWGFPDHVAKKRKNSQELLLCRGGTLSLPPGHPGLRHDLFVVPEIQELSFRPGQSKTVARYLLPIAEASLWDIKDPGVRDAEELFYDSEKRKVFARSLIRYGDIVLEENLRGASAGTATTDLLYNEIWRKNPSPHLTDAFPKFAQIFGHSELETFFWQRELFKKHFPERSTELRDDFGDVNALLQKAFVGQVSLASLAETDWPQFFKTHGLSESLGWEWDQLFPRSLNLNPKRRAPVSYVWDQEPWVESRLQDFFGMKESPKILKGRLALTLHLLAPNLRPVQVTKDLTSFWQKVYPEIRPALSRRYPRHPWPEKV